MIPRKLTAIYASTMLASAAYSSPIATQKPLPDLYWATVKEKKVILSKGISTSRIPLDISLKQVYNDGTTLTLPVFPIDFIKKYDHSVNENQLMRTAYDHITYKVKSIELIFTLDPDNEFREWNENNNTISFSYSIDTLEKRFGPSSALLPANIPPPKSENEKPLLILPPAVQSNVKAS